MHKLVCRQIYGKSGYPCMVEVDPTCLLYSPSSALSHVFEVDPPCLLYSFSSALSGVLEVDPPCLTPVLSLYMPIYMV